MGSWPIKNKPSNNHLLPHGFSGSRSSDKAQQEELAALCLGPQLPSSQAEAWNPEDFTYMNVSCGLREGCQPICSYMSCSVPMRFPHAVWTLVSRAEDKLK